MDYASLTDEEIKARCKEIARTSNSDEQIKQRIKDELGCPYTASVTSTSCGPMRMTMGMVFGPRGNIIGF